MSPQTTDVQTRPVPTTETVQPAPFRSILCGVDGTAESLEAARQAGALAGSETRIQLLAVTNEWGGDAILPKEHAVEALAASQEVLTTSRALIETRVRPDSPPWNALIKAAKEHDLLVLGRHYPTRVGGIVLGSAVTHAVHSSRVPVLVTTAPPEGSLFPERIIVGVDGTRDGAEAIRTAGRIAAFTGAEVGIVRVGWAQSPRSPQIARAMADFIEMTGVEPPQIVFGGTPHRELVNFACRDATSLIVLGSRGLRGISALHSISERVAHEAPCSVLVVRPRI